MLSKHRICAHLYLFFHPQAGFIILKSYFYLMCEYFCSCSSADEDNEDPSTKAHREKERRQANNVRER